MWRVLERGPAALQLLSLALLRGRIARGLLCRTHRAMLGCRPHCLPPPRLAAGPYDPPRALLLVGVGACTYNAEANAEQASLPPTLHEETSEDLQLYDGRLGSSLAHFAPWRRGSTNSPAPA